MNESTKDYISKRTELQKEIDCEQRNLRAATQSNSQVRRNTNTSRSDTNPSKLPFYYPRVLERNNEICEKKPYSINIPDHSIFSANYDVDTYLRRNLNFNKERHISTYDNNNDIVKDFEPNKNVVIEKAIVHDRTEERLKIADRSGEQQKIADRSGEQQKIADRPEWRHKIVDRPDEKVADINPSYAENVDTLPIPVLRHSPKRLREVKDEDTMSEAMKKVDDKWKVPAVQKNILKALPNDEGKSVNILTQLGSIRRQLQLEQLKLDKMTKDDV